MDHSTIIEIKKQFNKAAASYKNHANIQKIVAENLSSKINKSNDKLILDAGSGTGFISELLSAQNIIQIDLALAMCVQAKNLNPVICGDLHLLPFIDHSFDIIISSLAIQWCDFSQVIQEFKRIIKPQGKLYLTTIAPNNFPELNIRPNDFDLPSTQQLQDCLQIFFAEIKINRYNLIEEYTNLFQFNKKMLKTGTYLSSLSKLNQLHNFSLTWEIIEVECSN